MSQKCTSPVSAPGTDPRSSRSTPVKSSSSSFGVGHDAPQQLPQVDVLLNHSNSLMDSPSLPDSSIRSSPSFSPSGSSIGSSVPNSPLPTPDPQAQRALALHGDSTVIRSSPMAPLEGLPSLATLDCFSNSLGLEGEDFLAPKEQAVVVKSSDHGDTGGPTAGVSDANDDPSTVAHSLQLTLSLEHADSLREPLHGSDVHIHRGDGSRGMDARAGPIALNIIQHPYPPR